MSSDNLGSRSRGPVREDYERTLECGWATRWYGERANRPYVADLHDWLRGKRRAARNKQRGEHDRLAQRASAIAAKVKDHPLRILRVELRDVSGDVERTAAEARIGGLAVHRTIEPRQIHIANLRRHAVHGHDVHPPRCGLVLELDLVANKFNALLCRPRWIGARNYL